MAGRNPFTEADVHYLAQYLAKYYPENKGRLGNKPYQDLTEDVGGKWAWSRTHPWQSWRDYYKRNQEDMIVRIKKVQKKNALKSSQEGAGKMEGSSQAARPNATLKKSVKQEKQSGNGVDKGEGTSKPQHTNGQIKKEPRPVPRLTLKPSTSGPKKPEPRPAPAEDTAERAKVDNGHASTDSGYASKSKLPRQDSKESSSSGFNSSSTTQPPRVQHKAVKPIPVANDPPAQQPARAEVSFTVTSRQASETAPMRPIKIERKPVEEDVVEDSQAEEDSDDDDDSDTETEGSDEDNDTKPVDEDSYMHELFGSFDEDEEDVEEEHPASPAPSSPPYERIYPDISLAPEPAPADEPMVPGSFPSNPPKPLQESTIPKPSGNAPSSSPLTPPPPGQAPRPQHPSSPVKRSPRVKKVLKRKHIDDDDDPFVSTTPPASPGSAERHARMAGKGQPPTLVEGPFRNVYVKRRPRAESEDEDEDKEPASSWPPKRKKNNVLEKEKNGLPKSDNAAVESVDEDTRAQPVPATKSVSQKPTEAPKLNGPAQQKHDVAEQAHVSRPPPPPPPPPIPLHSRPKPQRQHINAVASSSRVKLPPSSTIPSVDHVVGTRTDTDAVIIPGDTKAKNPTKPQAKAATAPHVSSPPTLPATKKQKINHHPETSEQVAMAVAQKAPSTTQKLLPHEASTPSGSDVFMSKSLSHDKGKSRNVYDENAIASRGSVRHVDLRGQWMKHRVSRSRNSVSISASLTKRTSRGSSATSGSAARVLPRRDSDVRRWRQSTASIHSRASGAPTKSRLSTLSTAVNESLLLTVMEREVSSIAEEYGFASHFVRVVLAREGSFERTREALMDIRLRSGMEVYLEGLVIDGEASDDVDSEGVPEGVIPEAFKERGVAEKSSRMYVGKRPPARVVRRANELLDRQPHLVSRPRPSLEYKPLPPEAEDFTVEYSPPSKTRARRYVKLQREGREEEARMSLTSSGGSARKQRPSSLGRSHLRMEVDEEVEASPTPKRIDKSGSMDVDDGEEEQDREEEQGREQSQGVGNLPERQVEEEPVTQEAEVSDDEESDDLPVKQEDHEHPAASLAIVDDDEAMDIYASQSPLPSAAQVDIARDQENLENHDEAVLAEDSDQEKPDLEPEDTEDEAEGPYSKMALLEWGLEQYRVAVAFRDRGWVEEQDSPEVEDVREVEEVLTEGYHTDDSL